MEAVIPVVSLILATAFLIQSLTGFVFAVQKR